MADNASSKAFDYAAKNVIDLARVEAGSVSKVKAFLSGLESDLVKILNDNKDLSPGKKAKLETILNAAGSAIDSTYQTIGKSQAADLGGIAKLGSTAAVKGINHAIGVDVFGAVLTESQLAAVASETTVFGHASGDWWKSQNEGLRFKFAGQMKQGYALGEDVDALVRRVRGTKAGQFKDGIMQASRREAEALVRSSIQTISNEAALKSYAALGDTIKGIEWLSTLDTRTTLTCFDGSTRIAPIGRIRKVFRRAYQGQMFVIRTASGKQVSVTPNHPILTSKGWRSAEEIKPGDKVIDCMGTDVVAVGDDVEMHPTIASVADALFHPAISEIFEESSAATNFHGDGMGGDEKVEIATIKRELRNGFNPFPPDSVEHNALVWLHQSGCLSGDSGLSKLLFTGPPFVEPAEIHPGTLQSGIEPAFADAGFADDLTGTLPVGEHGHGSFDAGTCLVSRDVFKDTGVFQEGRDGRDGRPVFLGNGAGGFAISTTFEDVISVRSEFRAVHVYNLETCQGVYIAGGLLVKNCRALDGKVWTVPDLKPVGHDKKFPGPVAHWGCRSRQIPVLRSWAELSGKPIKALDGQTMEAKLKAKLAAKGMSADKIAMATANARASMDGQVSGSPDMEAWLKSKPDSFIKGVLGPTRAKMLAEGKITIADLTDQNNRPLTIAELQGAIDGDGFAVETEGIDFEPFDKSKLKGFTPDDAAAAQDAAKAKIASVLADPKAAGNSILSANLAKIQSAEPSLTPAELLAKAEEATAAKIAANTKSSILSKAKKKMLAGEEPTPAQKALIDDLGEDEKALFLEGVADAKTAKQITEANASATAKLTSWSADPIKQKAIDKALADGATADKPLELAAAADKALGDLVAGETAGNQLAAAKKAMKALTGMNAPTPAGVQAWLKQQGKDPAEFLAEFQAVTKEKADQSAKSSVLSKAKKKVAVGEAMTPAQQKLFDDLTPEEQASFASDVEAMKALKFADPLPIKSGVVNWNVKKVP